MTNNLYISATGPPQRKNRCGSGCDGAAVRKIDKVGFFRPIVQEKYGVDKDIHLMTACFNLGIPLDQMHGLSAEEATDLASHGRQEEVFEIIINRYNALKSRCDFVVCEGTDSLGTSSDFDFDINAEISKNLSASVLLVAGSQGKTVDETIQAVETASAALVKRKCSTIGTIITRTDGASGWEIMDRLSKHRLGETQLLYTIPEEPSLNRPTVSEIVTELGAEVLWGKEQLTRHVYNFSIAANTTRPRFMAKRWFRSSRAVSQSCSILRATG